VVLAGEGEAVVFMHRVPPASSPPGEVGGRLEAGGTPRTQRITYSDPDDLLEYFDTDIVLVEGRVGAWPSVSIAAESRPTADELAGNLDRIWRS
jgi:hypothetical protein